MTAETTDAPSVEVPRDRSGSSVLERYDLRPWDAAMLATALLSIVAFAPWLLFDAWTPRMALVVLWLPLGTAALVTAAVRGDVAARLLTATAAIALVSSLFSGDVWGSLVGVVGRDLSALTVVGAAGMWAVAREASPQGRRLLVDVVVWSAVASASIGVLQVVARIDDGALALVARRPTGFAVNPVFFGATCAAGALLAATRLAGSDLAARRVPMTLATVVLAAAVMLSGSRVALASTMVLVVGVVALRRDRPSAMAAATVVIGLALGDVLDRLTGTGRTATARFADSGGGGRSTIWGYGWDAVWERPVLGHGIGRFRAAVQADFSPDFVATSARDELSQAWFDPHNVGILLLVGVGLVGTVIAIAGVAVAARSSRGPAAWGAAAIALTWMLQPVGLATLPLAALLFGAAGRSSAPAIRFDRRLSGTLAAVGLAAAGYLVVADALLDRAADRFDADLAETAASLYVRDATVADVVSQLHEFDGDLDTALEWRRRATSWGSDRPYWWSRRAELAVAADRLDEADLAIASAAELQPSNVRTVRVDGQIAIVRGEADRLAAALAQLCALGEQAACDLDADEVIATANAAQAESEADR